MGSGSLKALIHSFRRINSNRVQEDIQLGSESAPASGRFEAALAERVQQLQLQGGGGSAHLNWLLDACACTLSTHTSLASLLTHTILRPASHRADEVLSLLDVCNSLKQVTGDVDRQLGLLQRALQIAEQALRAPQISSANLRAAVHRLRACLQGLNPVLGSKQLYRPAEDALVASLQGAKRFQLHPISSDPLNHALDGTLLLSLLVLTSALSSFERPTRCGATRTACKLIARYANSTCIKSSSAAVWVAPLRQLQRDIKQEEMGAFFLELEGLHASTASLLAAMTADHDHMNVDVMRRSVDSLRKRTQQAQACTLTLQSYLASLFQALLGLRLVLLH